MPFAWGAGSGLSIIIGGVLARRLAHRSGLILGLAAGMVLGIALFDLAPEAYRLAAGLPRLPLLLASAIIGLALYALLDRLSHAQWAGADRLRPHIGPASLFLHVVIDGFMVGIGFSVSSQTGLIIALAIVAHGLVHGINTVTLTKTGGGSWRTARMWLALNAVAPVIGVFIAGRIPASPLQLAVLLSAFAGVFVYIGAWELLPDARSEAGTAPIAAGVALMAAAAFLIGG